MNIREINIIVHMRWCCFCILRREKFHVLMPNGNCDSNMRIADGLSILRQISGKKSNLGPPLQKRIVL